MKREKSSHSAILKQLKADLAGEGVTPSNKELKTIIDSYLELVEDTFVKGGTDITLGKLGTLKMVETKSRTYKPPRCKPIIVPVRNTAKFYLRGTLKSIVNNLPIK